MPGLGRKELRAVVARAVANGWRVVEGSRPNHYLAYPPVGDGERGRTAVGFSVTGCPKGLLNIYAAFRREGLELDPRRLPRART